MSGEEPEDDGDSEEDEILSATATALAEHGYADLTMQHIADEAGVSTSLLHYHYDTKQALLAALLEDIIEDFSRHVEAVEHYPPRERLAELVEMLIFSPDSEGADLYTALLELMTQAPYEAAYREQFRQNEVYLRGVFAGAIADGIDEGVFRPTDPDRAARLLLSTIRGARMNRVLLNEPDDPAVVRAAIEEHVVGSLLAGEDTGADESGENDAAEDDAGENDAAEDDAD